ncbi:MAG: PIN domain-containing protein [Desulfoferrobacter sp.]
MYLLDTNILSELIKKRPNANLIKRLAAAEKQSLCTSCICAMELRHGSALRADFEKFWQRVAREILGRVRVISLGYEEMIIAGDILAQLKKSGLPIGIEDVLIAATAISHRLVVIAGNTRHFGQVQGLLVENWLIPNP